MSALEDAATNFASELNATLSAVFGGSDPLLEMFYVEDRQRAIIQPIGGSGGIALKVNGEHVLDLEISYELEMGKRSGFLKVISSRFLIRAEGESAPVASFDFDEGYSESLPAAHINLHTESHAVQRALELAGNRGRPARRRKKGHGVGGHGKAGDLHYPVGGVRFRPCLEDVLQMLLIELDLDRVDTNWRSALKAGRRTWRDRQLASAIMDNPAVAVTVLERLNYTVKWDGEGSPPDANLTHLQRI